MRNGKKIYFVTVFYLDKEHREKQSTELEIPEGWSSRLYKRIRCWGWFEKEEDAEACIRENWTDIYENGYYNLAMIEPMTQGPLCVHPRQNRWFDVEYVDQNTYNVTEIEKPERFKHICGFSYA